MPATFKFIPPNGPSCFLRGVLVPVPEESEEPTSLAFVRLIRDRRSPDFEGWNFMFREAVCWLGHRRIDLGALRAALSEQKRHVEGLGRSIVEYSRCYRIFVIMVVDFGTRFIERM
jgi:hypothetical protein